MINAISVIAVGWCNFEAKVERSIRKVSPTVISCEGLCWNVAVLEILTITLLRWLIFPNNIAITSVIRVIMLIVWLTAQLTVRNITWAIVC